MHFIIFQNSVYKVLYEDLSIHVLVKLKGYIQIWQCERKQDLTFLLFFSMAGEKKPLIHQIYSILKNAYIYKKKKKKKKEKCPFLVAY